MESVCGFIPNYLQTASLFIDGETHDQKESMIFWLFGSVAGCSWTFMLVQKNSQRIFGQI